ncbi:hypothetical protein AGIG_G4663 [Arapaima gigas]
MTVSGVTRSGTFCRDAPPPTTTTTGSSVSGFCSHRPAVSLDLQRTRVGFGHLRPQPGPPFEENIRRRCEVPGSPVAVNHC